MWTLLQETQENKWWSTLINTRRQQSNIEWIHLNCATSASETRPHLSHDFSLPILDQLTLISFEPKQTRDIKRQDKISLDKTYIFIIIQKAMHKIFRIF